MKAVEPSEQPHDLAAMDLTDEARKLLLGLPEGLDVAESIQVASVLAQLAQAEALLSVNHQLKYILKTLMRSRAQPGGGSESP